MNNYFPLISIITPTYDNDNELQQTILSVLNQKFNNYEYIIVDGFRSEKTKKVINKFNDDRIVLISENDKGIYDAMNKGVKHAKGQYVIFLGSGDTFYDINVLNMVKPFLNGRNDIVYGYVYFTDKQEIFKYMVKVNLNYTFRIKPVCHQALFSKRALLIEYPFDIQYRYCADQDWIMKMYKYKMHFKYMDLPIVYYPLTGISSTSIDNSPSKEHVRIRSIYYPIRGTLMKFLRKIKYVIKENKTQIRKH